jgi:hypothetical protein
MEDDGMRGTFARFFTILFCALTLGCGSGGGGSAGTAHPGQVATRIKTSGLLAAGETLGAIKLTLSIPPGVSVPLDPVTHAPASGVVSLVGASDPAMVFQFVRYTPATATVPGSLGFVVVNAQGFGPVEYIGVQLDVSAGSFPVAGDFIVSDFAVAGISTYTEIPITNPTVTVSIN